MSAMGDLARQDLENRLRPRVSPKRRSLTYIPRSRKRSEPVNSSSATHLSFPFRLQPARAKSREAWKRHLRPSLWCISQSIGRAAYVCTVYGRASLYIYISIYVYIYIHIYIYIYIYIYRRKNPRRPDRAVTRSCRNGVIDFVASRWHATPLF